MGFKESFLGLALLYTASSGASRCEAPDVQQQTEVHGHEQSRITQVTRENFNDVVVRSSRPVVVKFYADWCGACQEMEAPYRRASDAMSNRLTFTSFDVESDRTIPRRYGVRSIPTFLVFEEGRPVCRYVGVRNIQADLESCLANH